MSIMWSTSMQLVLCPDPTLSWGKGSGDYWVVPWLCWVNSLDFGQANKNSKCVTNEMTYLMQACNQCSFITNTADLAQPRNRSIVTKPFFFMRGWGLGMRQACNWKYSYMYFTVVFILVCCSVIECIPHQISALHLSTWSHDRVLFQPVCTSNIYITTMQIRSTDVC